MSVEAAEAIASTPVYAPRASGETASHRLLITQNADAPDALKLQEQFAAEGNAVVMLSQGVAGDDFTAQLAALLADAKVGTHLYVCGEESFIWQVQALAHQAGLLDEEMSLFKVGQRRKLYCVHCSTLQDVDGAGEVSCTGCGVKLLVRNHFSRRLGAYMGVCLDADDPRGEGKA